MSLGTAVFDASPLIVFHQIGQFELLRGLFTEMLVPTAVAQEVAPSLGTLPAWIDVRSLSTARTVLGALDAGERAAIMLALHLAADYIVLDDLPGRRVATRYGLTVVGSLGLLLRAKDHGLIEMVRPPMDEMMACGLFVTEGIYLDILVAAGEAE